MTDWLTDYSPEQTADDSVTKQYILVVAKGRRCSKAGKVTAGLAENNDSATAAYNDYRTLQADSLETEISSEPDAHSQVFTLLSK